MAHELGAIPLPAKRGIGFAYHAQLTEQLLAQPGLIDFCELSPDILCRERLLHGERQLVYEPTLFEEAQRVLSMRPLVVHGLGLSIGSAHGWNHAYLDRLDELHGRRSFAWHSEHLAYLFSELNRESAQIGVPLPLPFTDDALALLVPRVRALHARYRVPFLLENLTYYLPDLPSDHGRDEVDFLNALVEQADGFLLLDLYNFSCNAKNFGFDPYEALSRLRLDRVIELHVAGGTSFAGFEMDVHSRVVPSDVWQLLDWIAPQTRNLAGIVYEVLEEAVPHVGAAAIRTQLERARVAWELHLRRHGSARRGSAPREHRPSPVREQRPARSLAPLQRALRAYVVGGASGTAAVPSAETGVEQLSAGEQTWLIKLRDSPGLHVTAYIARWWRETKIEKMAQLTLAGLRADERTQLVDAYLRSQPVSSLFFQPEAIGFLNFVAAAQHVHEAVRAVARFERAILSSREASSAPAGAAIVVCFPAPVTEVLHAVVSAAELPSSDGGLHYALVDAQLPDGFALLAEPRPAAAVRYTELHDREACSSPWRWLVGNGAREGAGRERLRDAALGA